jgi:hypothetical protein
MIRAGRITRGEKLAGHRRVLAKADPRATKRDKNEGAACDVDRRGADPRALGMGVGSVGMPRGVKSATMASRCAR